MGVKTRLVASIAGAGVALLAPTATAFAVERFASPTGSSVNPCTQVAPCDILTAVNGSSLNDDVTIEPGTYGPLPAPLFDGGHTLTIHGQTGTPRPVILSSVTGGIFLGGMNSSLSDVEFDVPSAKSIGISSGGTNVRIDRVIGHVLGGNSTACLAFKSITITNSLCVADGPGPESYAFRFIGEFAGATLRNDTLEAPGGSGGTGGVAVLASGEGGHRAIVTVSNTIAHGASVDLLAKADSFLASEATILADHSNYLTDSAKTEGGKASVTPHGTETNQTSAPLFANASMDDFHELAGSPTIGAGFNSPANGTLDLDGNPRQFGGSADIGAYQFIPPPAVTPSAAPTLSAPPAAPVGGGAPPAPSDSQPVLSPTTFAALPSGPSVIARAAKGTTITYTDTQAATTTFVVRSPAGKGVLVRGKCVKPPRKGKRGPRGRSCTRYTTLGSFGHADTAGANRLRFSGRVRGRALKPGRYQLVSAPTNAAGKAGATHINTFKIVSR